MVKQIRFEDLVGDIYGGLLVEDIDNNRYIICGHCGQIIYLNENEEDYKIIEIYENWVDLSEEITGY